MNTTPLVDVMLVLLILFIITLPVMTNSTNLHIAGGPAPPIPRDTINLAPELHVLPDRRANYDAVAKVLAIAQRSGMQRIGFAGQERFKE
jgi:biopolymer transport protein ExbD